MDYWLRNWWLHLIGRPYTRLQSMPAIRVGADLAADRSPLGTQGVSPLPSLQLIPLDPGRSTTTPWARDTESRRVIGAMEVQSGSAFIPT